MNSPALVLVHGYPLDHTLWEHVIPLIAPGVQVLAPDLPGFGGRPAAAAEPSLEHIADDLAELLAQRGIPEAVLAGMSMGGYVALAFAERHASKLAGLALVSSQAAPDTDEARSNRRAMIEKVRVQGPGVAADAAAARMFAPGDCARPEWVRYPKSAAATAGVDGVTWALEAMARRPDRTAVFRALQVPVAVVHGTEDQLIPIARARELAALPVNGCLVEIPGVGHGTPVENPKAVAAALNALLARCARR